MSSLELIALVFFAVWGIGSIVVGSTRIYQTVLFIQSAYSARGVIVHNRRELEGADGGDIVRYSRIEFQARNGLVVEFEDTRVAETFIVRRRQKVGTEVSVLYDPTDPHNAKWDAFHSLWSQHILYMIWGAILVSFSLWWLSGLL
ncbi:hypothetical protein BH18ACT10_BH18ACT10_15090 [soil metagenome]